MAVLTAGRQHEITISPARTQTIFGSSSRSRVNMKPRANHRYATAPMDSKLVRPARSLRRALTLPRSPLAAKTVMYFFAPARTMLCGNDTNWTNRVKGRIAPRRAGSSAAGTSTVPITRATTSAKRRTTNRRAECHQSDPSRAFSRLSCAVTTLTIFICDS